MTGSIMNNIAVQTKKLWVIFAIIGLMSLAVAASSTTPIVGPQFPIGHITATVPFNQELPAVAAGGPGYLVVWQDKRNQFDYDIYGMLVDTAGNPVSGQSFLISTMYSKSAPNDQIYPSVSYNGTDFLVVWVDKGTNGQNPHIYGSRVSAAGALRDSTSFAISTTGTYTQTTPAVASNGTDWEVVWEEDVTTGGNIVGAKVSAAGVVSASVSFANSSNDELNPSIAWGGSYYLVAWEDSRSVETTGINIYACRASTAGAKVTSSEVAVSTATGAQIAPSVAGVSTGGFLVVWQDSRGTSEDIYAARVTSAGVVTDTQGLAICTVDLDQETPSAGWNGTNYCVAWRDKGASRKIRGSRVSSTGQVLDSGGKDIFTGVAGTGNPSVAANSGSSLVVWSTLDVTNADVYSATFNSSGVVGGLTALSVSVQDQPQYAAVFDGTEFITVWSDRRSGSYALYAARVSTNGTVLDTQGVQLPTNSVSQQTEPAIAWSGSNLLITWTDGVETGRNIRGLIVDRNLTTIVPAFNICIADLEQYSPAVAWNGTKYLVVWTDGRQGVAPNYSTDIAGALVSTSGVVTSTPFVSQAVNSQYNPCVTSDGSNCLVAWQDDRTSYSDLYCARVSGTGAILDSAGVRVSSVTSNKTSPKLSYDGTNYMAVWSDNRSGSNDIYSIRLSKTVARLSTTDTCICSQPLDQSAPSVSWSGAEYFVTWQDYRTFATTDYDIYLARVDVNGQLIQPPDILLSGKSNPEITPMVVGVSHECGAVFYSDLLYSFQQLAGRIIGGPDIPTPTVLDDGQYTTSTSSLHASWSVGSAQSLVSEYDYAIGTSPGATNVVDWTSAGLATEKTVSGLSLTNGSTYYFAVKAKSTFITWSGVGVSDGITLDRTAPSTPVVTDDGQYACSSQSLHASWSASDAESGIVEYQYAIGTSSGATNIVGWTSVGTATEVTKDGLSLNVGSTYYITVKAKNGVGLWGHVGTSDGIALPAAVDTIAAAKALANGTWLSISGKVVSAGTNQLPVLPDGQYFYIEENDRLAAIKVASSIPAQSGNIVSITGHVETVGNEKQITANCVTVTSTSGIVPKPLYMTNKALRGSFLCSYDEGGDRPNGPCNLGLLTSTSGVVTYVGNTSDGFFYIDDGCLLSDGSGRTGVKVYYGALSEITLDSHVFVTGINSCEPSGSTLVRRVLATNVGPAQ